MAEGPAIIRDLFTKKVFCDQTECKTATEYIDHGGLRRAIIPTSEHFLYDDGRLHRFADHIIDVPPDYELRGISNGDLRVYLKLPIGKIPFAKH